MVTKAQAVSAHHRQEFHCGTCTRTIGPKGGEKLRTEVWRVNGACKVWKTRPEAFSLPIKYGFKGPYAYITEQNAAEFHAAERPRRTTGTILSSLGRSVEGSCLVRAHPMDGPNGGQRTMEYILDTSLATETWESLTPFTRGYITAAMWTLTDDNGESCDHLGLHDIAPETLQIAIADCAAFVAANRATLDEALDEQKDRTDEHHGHDLWLTRNGHGCGFWDRGYSAEVSKVLTDAAHAEGSADWYIGDDGMIYQM